VKSRSRPANSRRRTSRPRQVAYPQPRSLIGDWLSLQFGAQAGQPRNRALPEISPWSPPPRPRHPAKWAIAKRVRSMPHSRPRHSIEPKQPLVKSPLGGQTRQMPSARFRQAGRCGNMRACAITREPIMPKHQKYWVLTAMKHLHAPLWGIAAAGLLATLSIASAQQSYRGTQDAQQACTDDVFRLCNQFIPDRQRIVACLVRNRRSLSPACHAVFSRGPETSRRARHRHR
jgi:hypothetical protein